MATIRRSSMRNRRLACEALETRSLLSADGLCVHNFRMPEDANNDGTITPLDALVVINQINSNVSASASTKMVDVNADGYLSPLDALVVVNYINRSTMGSPPSASQVDLETRIAKLEHAISNKQLPVGLDIASANELLATMKAGGHPELGDRVIGGQLAQGWNNTTPVLDKTAVEITEASVDEELAPSSDSNEAESQVQHWIDRLAHRLKALQVSEQVMSTITTEIANGAATGNPLTLGQIKTRLTELHVDVSKVFPNRADAFVSRLTDKLTAAGVSSEVIQTIASEVRAGFQNHKPLSFSQIRDRLVELGVDVSKLFPTPENQFVDRLVDKLKDAGVTQAVISTIASEIRAGIAAQKPLTLDQIRTRLVELGVDVSKIFPEVPKLGDVKPPVELVVAILKRANVSADVIDTVAKAMKSANVAGSPLTVSQILDQLHTLGVSLPKLLEAVLRGNGR